MLDDAFAAALTEFDRITATVEEMSVVREPGAIIRVTIKAIAQAASSLSFLEAKNHEVFESSIATTMFDDLEFLMITLRLALVTHSLELLSVTITNEMTGMHPFATGEEDEPHFQSLEEA